MLKQSLTGLGVRSRLAGTATKMAANAEVLCERVLLDNDVFEWANRVDANTPDHRVWTRTTAPKANEIIKAATAAALEDRIMWLWNDCTDSRCMYIYTGWMQGLGTFGHLVFTPVHHPEAVVLVRPRVTLDKVITIAGWMLRGRVRITGRTLSGNQIYEHDYPITGHIHAVTVRTDIRRHLMLYHDLSPYQDVKLVTEGGVFVSARRKIWAPNWVKNRKVIMRAWLKQSRSQLLIKHFFFARATR